MKLVLISLLIVFGSVSTAFSAVTFTEEQMKNTDIIDKEIRKKDPDYNGFNGVGNKFTIMGISEQQFKNYLADIDLTDVKAKDPKRKKKKEALDILKAGIPNLTDEHLQALGLKAEE